MYQLKSVVRRVILLLPITGLLGALTYQAIAPALSHADALNPLTERSLLLTSSSPGWAYTDGSGDSQYAPAGSGPNGQQTGQTFTFNTSTDSTGGGSAALKAFTFQYCTTAAGDCLAPGDDMDELAPGGAGTGCTEGTAVTPGNYVCPADTPGAPNYTDDSSHTDFNVVEGGVTTTAGSIASLGTGWSEGGTVPGSGADANIPQTTDGDFQVYLDESGTWTASSGWTMKIANLEDLTDIVTHSAITGQTGANNYIILTNSTGITPPANEKLEVQFQPNSSNYITNPGQDAFFVKINDYNSAAYENFYDNYPYDITGTSPHESCGTETNLSTGDCPDNVVDGGVTVAQVMNQSIEIQTKVLETMDFSVGTVDPDTLTPGELSTDTDGVETVHGSCNPILPYDQGNVANTPANPAPNTLLLGNQSAEYSLSTTQAYDTHSLFRVSTNAANGATVYYSGETLSDTEDNQIAPIGDTATTPNPGTAQFGLALDQDQVADSTDYYAADDDINWQVPYEASLDSTASTGFLADLTANSGSAYWYEPTLSPLIPTTQYGGGYGTAGALSTASFAFDANANTVPVPLATESVQVVNCATGDVRYVADIAPSTPAGIYTTAINYLAAPEY